MSREPTLATGGQPVGPSDRVSCSAIIVNSVPGARTRDLRIPSVRPQYNPYSLAMRLYCSGVKNSQKCIVVLILCLNAHVQSYIMCNNPIFETSG